MLFGNLNVNLGPLFLSFHEKIEWKKRTGLFYDGNVYISSKLNKFDRDKDFFVSFTYTIFLPRPFNQFPKQKLTN